MIEHPPDYPSGPGSKAGSSTSERAAMAVYAGATEFERSIADVLMHARRPMSCDAILRELSGGAEGFELEAFILRHRTRVYQAHKKDLIEEVDDLGVSYRGRSQYRYCLWSALRDRRRSLELLA